MTLQTCSFRRGGVALHPKGCATRNTPSTRYCCNTVAQHLRNTPQQLADLAGIIRRNPQWLFRPDHRRMLKAMFTRITTGRVPGRFFPTGYPLRVCQQSTRSVYDTKCHMT